jgi:hypothetical protein
MKRWLPALGYSALSIPFVLLAAVLTTGATHSLARFMHVLLQLGLIAGCIGAFAGMVAGVLEIRRGQNSN